MDGILGSFSEVWIPKELASVVIESKGVAGAVASDKILDLGKFSEVWQAKSLEGAEQELEDGALTGVTGRGTIPTDMPAL